MSLNLRDAIITSIWKLKLFSRDIFLLSFASRGEKLISAFVSWSNCEKKKTRCKLLPFSQTWIPPSLKSEKKFLARFYKASHLDLARCSLNRLRKELPKRRLFQCQMRNKLQPLPFNFGGGFFLSRMIYCFGNNFTRNGKLNFSSCFFLPVQIFKVSWNAFLNEDKTI